MAKRESQGLQIALILVVMAAVLLAVTTILFWNQSTKATAAADAAKKQSSEANQRLNQTVTENQTLKELIGYPVDESVDKIQAEYETDMVRFGQYPEEQRNYRELPKFLDSTIQQQLAEINKYDERVRDLESANQQLTEDRDKLVAVERQGHDEAGQDLLSTRNDWTSDREKVKAEREALQSQFRQERQKLVQQLAAAKKRAEDLDRENGSLKRNNQNLSRQLAELQDESFEIPDGTITWVSQRGHMAYIDLGSADSLRRQTTFSVYDVDASGVASDARKGSIEVLRIVSDHLAEARITEDSVTNPIVAGDVIYSPIWEAGNPIRFALSGFMDVDGDRKSDRELIKRLIAVNGGVIDAEVDDEGNRTGEVTLNSRYLVVGEDVTDKTRNVKLLAADQELRGEASALGMTVISVDRLLSDLGYQRVSKSVTPGQMDEVP